MSPETKNILLFLIGDEDIDSWLNGYNHAFKMTPQEMIDLGRESEVVKHLEWAAYGPW